jgi:hypothetical protein
MRNAGLIENSSDTIGWGWLLLLLLLLLSMMTMMITTIVP